MKKDKQIETLYKLELKGICDWLKAKQLTLNVDKFNLVLPRRPKKKVTESIILKINNKKKKKKKIKEKEYVKYLGVILNNRISWGNHISHPNLKLARDIVILTKLSIFVSKDILTSLYFAFVQSYIDNGVILWGTAMKSTAKKLAQNLKKALRNILFKSYNAQSVPLSKELNILSFYKQKTLAILQFMWKLYNNNIP